MDDYFSKPLPDLRALAKERRIRGFSVVGKRELVKRLDAWDAARGIVRPPSAHPRYWGMRLPELEQYAREHHVRGFAGKNKPALVALLERHDREAPPAAIEQPPCPAPAAGPDYAAIPFPQLRKLAGQRGIRDILKHTKAELIAELQRAPVADETPRSPYADLKLPKLRTLAKQRGIRDILKHSKPELIAALERGGTSAPANHPPGDTRREEVDYSDKTLAELRTLAKQHGLHDILRMSRLAIIEALQPRKSSPPPDAAPAPEKPQINIDGFLEVMPEGFGFIRSHGYHSGDNDTYVTPSLVRRFRLRSGDRIAGARRLKSGTEKFAALSFVATVNGVPALDACGATPFESLTPVYPNRRYNLEVPGGSIATRIINLVSPVGRGQRGLIVSPPKAGKTTLLKDIGRSLIRNHPEAKLIILLVGERPEEVTDIQQSLVGENVEVVASTFDEPAEQHRRCAELTLERAKHMVEQRQDVVILMDSITRMTRAYNLATNLSGRLLSGGLDSAALTIPKKFFGSARNTSEGGSLTILATALIETGSKLDDVVYEEFKGTGNMELTLTRKLQERRIFPAIDIAKSGTRREDLLLTPDELGFVNRIRRASQSDKDMDYIISMFAKTTGNAELVKLLNR